MANVLKKHKIKGYFFFTGDFLRNPAFNSLVKRLKQDGHYLGAHSDKHLLYCDWTKRDSLLVTKEQFLADLAANYAELAKFGISKNEVPYYLPPYEWYNKQIVTWCKELGISVLNFTPGTGTNADYTTPELKNYRNNDTIYQNLMKFEQKEGLSGAFLLIHLGTDPKRTDKFYLLLEKLIEELMQKGYLKK